MKTQICFSKATASFCKKLNLGDNCIQKNFHLGRYIVGYTVGNSVLRRRASRVGNLVLRRRASGAVKRELRTYILRYTSPNENFEYGYPHSNALLQSHLKFESCKPHKAARHPTKCDIINDVKLFPTVYHSFTGYKIKCIRIPHKFLFRNSSHTGPLVYFG